MQEEHIQKASTKAKTKYNNKMYSSINVRLPKQLVADFKTKCIKLNISTASVIRKAVEDFINN